MKSKPYRRRPGDLEIRVLKDGRVAFIGPDQAMIEVARDLDVQATDTERERTGNAPQSGATSPCK